MHARISRIMGDAEGVVRDLFDHYCAAPEDLPGEWAHGAGHVLHLWSVAVREARNLLH